MASLQAQPDILSLSRGQALAFLSEKLATPFDKLTVGVAIIRHRDWGEPEILLLQRRLDEAYYPGVFEMPGGKVDESDSSVQHAIAREAMEESNLRVSSILQELSLMTYTTEKTVSYDDGSEKNIQRRAVQVSYVVEADNLEDFRLNPSEHANSVWAKSSELGGLEITSDMGRLVVEALSWAGARGTRCGEA
ncbi:hypothetical protein GQ53DRAFT_815837 [Thozetella sp. PMI_491]|nr:hypothetical protein GQ53DRAFT_815837 [Thozetella sp. PMI_491]